MSFKLKRVESLFPTPLVLVELPDHEDLNARLLKEIAKRRSDEQSQDRSNRHGWHSAPDLFKRTEPAQADLAKRLVGMTMAATQKITGEGELPDVTTSFDGWININPAGAYNAPHDHPGALWSGCYYVSVPKPEEGNPDAGAIEFLADRPSSPYTRLVKTAMTSDKVKVRPKPGMVLLFPARVRHWVHPHQADEERVTIAFNATFRKVRPAGAARPRS